MGMLITLNGKFAGSLAHNGHRTSIFYRSYGIQAGSYHHKTLSVAVHTRFPCFIFRFKP